MTSVEPQNTQSEPDAPAVRVSEPVTYYLIAVASNKDADVWSAVCYQKRPSHAEIESSDQVYRFTFAKTLVWVLIRGDLMTYEFCRRLAMSRMTNANIWLHIDLSQFDMNQPRRG